MIKTFFKEIAEKENGDFYYKDQDISIGLGVRSPNVLFRLDIDYKNHKIIIDNRTGTSFAGIATIKFDSISHPIGFQITSISHLKNLFLRKKSRLIIKSENNHLISHIQNDLAFKKLNEIAIKTAFSPFVNATGNGCPFLITMEYHLEFEDWTQVIEPIIDFYKNLADYLDR